VPCVLPEDPGDVIAAINTYRSSHGQPAITGTATPAAGSCALHSGDAAFCSPSYFWMPVPALDGTQVVDKIAAFANGGTWLLDLRLTAITVGWAQLSTTQFACAINDTSPPQ
jgi:hypothetical protein